MDVAWNGDDRGDALVAGVYAAGVIVWAIQPHWLTRQPLLPAVVVMFGLSGLLGVVSGHPRTLLVPILFGLLIGVISAATVNGDLGRVGEFAVAAVWGVTMAAVMGVGIWLRNTLS